MIIIDTIAWIILAFLVLFLIIAYPYCYYYNNPNYFRQLVKIIRRIPLGAWSEHYIDLNLHSRSYYKYKEIVISSDGDTWVGTEYFGNSWRVEWLTRRIYFALFGDRKETVVNSLLKEL